MNSYEWILNKLVRCLLIIHRRPREMLYSFAPRSREWYSFNLAFKDSLYTLNSLLSSHHRHQTDHKNVAVKVKMTFRSSEKKSKRIYKWLLRSIQWKLIIKKTSARSRPETNHSKSEYYKCSNNYLFSSLLGSAEWSDAHTAARRAEIIERRIVNVSLKSHNLTHASGGSWLEAPVLMRSLGSFFIES